MKRNISRWICLAFLAAMAAACGERADVAEELSAPPPLLPDYTEVTVPASIAPLNFTVQGAFERINAVIEGRDSAARIRVQGKDGIRIPPRKWKALLEANKGGSIRITVAVRQNGRWRQYAPFTVYISPYPVDYGLAYRLIAPGYEVYSRMGIYQRTLSGFAQTPVMENTLAPGSCVNCHSFRETAPGSLSLHIRGEYGGTLLQTPGKTTLLNLNNGDLVSSGVYPYWHPSGRYIAYSVNRTQQMFHAAADERIEVVDLASDLIVYDIEANRILTSPLLKTEDFETFPAFSPDGCSLYFSCSAKRRLPDEYKDIRYNLCRIDFHPATGTFGDRIDTLIHAAGQGKSISFPRPSYDGRYLMYTQSDYGNFSIWHREADLWLLDLTTGDTRPLTGVNSADTESYHSWSSNSRWFVFSSRRGDGLYTRLYLASIDEDGKVSKPFLLPQQKATPHDALLLSYNVPEFISGPVEVNVRDVERRLTGKKRLLPE
jgi:hypothetical protein